MLAHLFRSCPESVRDRSAAGDAELQRADELAASILTALHGRKAPDPGVKAALDVRNRAFTVFTRGYDQMRQAVVFMRWKEKDANRVVPSLYAKRRQARKKAGAKEMPAMNDAVGRVGGSNHGGATRIF